MKTEHNNFHTLRLKACVYFNLEWGGGGYSSTYVHMQNTQSCRSQTTKNTKRPRSCDSIKRALFYFLLLSCDLSCDPGKITLCSFEQLRMERIFVTLSALLCAFSITQAEYLKFTKHYEDDVYEFINFLKKPFLPERFKTLEFFQKAVICVICLYMQI